MQECSMEHILPLNNKRALWKMKKKLVTTDKKNNKTHWKKPKHYLHQVFICFYCSKMSLWLFSLLPMIHWKHNLFETIQFHWGFIYYRKLFLSFCNLTLISVNTRIFVNTDNKHMEKEYSFENKFRGKINWKF